MLEAPPGVRAAGGPEEACAAPDDARRYSRLRAAGQQRQRARPPADGDVSQGHWRLPLRLGAGPVRRRQVGRRHGRPVRRRRLPRHPCRPIWKDCPHPGLSSYHADETAAVVRGGGHYIWIFANFTTVVYVYSESRDGGVLKNILENFAGVLVSD